MRRLWARPAPLGWAVLVLGVVIFVLARRYNDAQCAADAHELRRIVEDGAPWRFAVAAVVDMPFALAYGLFGLALGWRHRPEDPAGWERARRVAGTAIAVGAVSDLIENALVLANTLGRAGLTDGRVDLMRSFGLGKWTLGGVGYGVLVLAWCRRRLDRS